MLLLRNTHYIQQRDNIGKINPSDHLTLVRFFQQPSKKCYISVRPETESSPASYSPQSVI